MVCRIVGAVALTCLACGTASGEVESPPAPIDVDPGVAGGREAGCEGRGGHEGGGGSRDASGRPGGGGPCEGDAGQDGQAPLACVDHDPLRQVFFGDLHVHTSFSADAYRRGTRLNPDDAYAFAKGEPVAAAAGADGGTVTLSIDRPLDFVAVTDHAEWLSAETGSTNDRVPSPGPARDAWLRTIEAASRALEGPPSCRFTSFIAYEWTGTPGRRTPSAPPTFDLRSRYVWIHRNVIFGTDFVPEVPVNAYDVPKANELFARLRSGCKDLAGGICDVITIPHNTNYSQRFSFKPSSELTAEQARARAEIEPLAEIYQAKGNSECKQGVDNDDPYCKFETLGQPLCTGENAGACQPLCGAPDAPDDLRCEQPLSYVRTALKTGLAYEQELGENPLKLGIIASTDNHNGQPGAVAENAFVGSHGTDDRDARDRLDTWFQGSPGGLAAIWAEENSRAALFAALKRRETYGTSGPRMVVRFFGGWRYPAAMCNQTDLVARGYADGVPMGGDLPPRPEGSKAPSFVLWAARDLGTPSRSGTPLQQLQIIKGWVDSAGATHERVFTVAGDPNNGASVDTDTCELSGPGHDELCAQWEDPEYAPDQHAFYYARVIENPSCRYTAYDCAKLPLAQRPAGCTDGSVALTTQERAWTSPIWVRPQ